MKFISPHGSLISWCLPKLLRIQTSLDANANQQPSCSATKEIKGLGDQGKKKKKKGPDLEKEEMMKVIS